MSHIERDIPRKVVIAHESPDAHIGAKVGGAAAVALNQSREMHKMGRSVQLIGPRNGGKGALDIPHELFEMPEVTSNDELLDVFRSSDKWMTYWQKALQPEEEKECDIYGHYYVTGGIMSELNGSIKGRRLYMGHSWDKVVERMDPGRVITPTRAKAEASILANSDAVVVSTDAEKHMIAQDYQQSIPGGQKAILDKIHVVPLGVDEKVFAPENLARNREEYRGKLLKFLKNTLNFYMVGRIAPQKNQLLAIEAFTEALKTDPKLNVSLSIFGGTLEDNRYYDVVRKYLLEQPAYIQAKVKFHDVMPADIAHAVGDVFLGPSVWETFFLAAAEAMASRKPTIVSDKPILREVVGGGSLFVDETNAADIAFNIDKMATDERLRQCSSDYNFNRAWKRYTWEKSARRLDEVWQGLRQ